MIPVASAASGNPADGTTPWREDGKSPKGSLIRWLATAAGVDADRLLAQMLEADAWPAVDAVVRRKFGSRSEGPDADDVVSEARLQVVRSLQRLRAHPPSEEKLADFNLPAYAATIAYTAWASDLRRRHPERSILLNSLRYLLENRAGPRGFALWQDAGGERLAGFATWQTQGRAVQPSPRQQWLVADPPAAAAQAFGGAARVPSDLADLTAGLLDWLGGPVELRDLTRALTDLRGLNAPQAHALDAGESEPADPGPSPHEALRWKEYLGWLWREVMALPVRQRTAFLCHSSLLREMELCGLTSIRAAAAALEIAPQRMAEIWTRLPLNDLDIAALLGDGSRQQVINLRKVARATLGNAWRESQRA